MNSTDHLPYSETLVNDMRRAYRLGSYGLVIVAITVLGLGSLDRALVRASYESRELTKVARQARLLAVDRESAIRGFLLTGNEQSLEPDVNARRLLPQKLDSLVQMTAKNASRRDRAEGVRRAVERWERGYLTPAMADAAASKSSANQTLAGKELFDSVRSSFASFINSEERLYQRRVSFEQGLVRFSVVAIFLEIVFVLLMMRRLNGRVVGQAEQVVEQQEQLEEQAVELEQQTVELEQQAVFLAERNDESRDSAVALEKTNRELTNAIRDLETARDESRRFARERERAQTLLDFFLSSSPVGFGLFDKSLRFTLVNESMAVINGMPAEKLIGKSPRDLVSPELAQEAEELLHGVLATGEPVLNVPLTGSTATQPGVQRYWLVSYFPVRSGSDEKPLGVGIMCTEVTERRKLEEQLGEAQKMEAVGRLAGGIAHDFNNLLTAIKSYSELLLTEIDESNPQHGDILEINSAADRAAQLTRQLLAFSRQQVMRLEVIDLNQIVADMQSTLRPLAGSRVRIKTQLSSVGIVKADQTQIERVIVNLVTNARDAMPDGGLITIETSNVDLDGQDATDHEEVQPGPYVLLTVSDSGVGMTAATKERLFEPFFTTKPRGKGTGLGLSSVYGIVKQSGGQIRVYSEPGLGTTFRIYLPRDERPRAQEAPDRPRARPTAGATIILVEDDEVVRNVACRVLKRAGFAVLEAENGKEAIDLYEATDYNADLILTDVVMPEMGGSELAERVRRINPGVKILFMSGYTEDKVIRDNLMAPGAAFLEKPFTPDMLTRKTREVLAAPAKGVAA